MINLKYIIAGLALTVSSVVAAQDTNQEGKFAIKAHADMGIGDAVALRSAVPDMKYDSSSSNFGIDFGWTIWHLGNHSVQAFVGLGYGSTSVNTDMAGMKFHYFAPPEADMDKDTYIRYTDIDALHQKIKSERITLPLYAAYRYRFSKVFSLHASLGFRFSYNYTSKVTAASGNIFNYGIYPQYDYLMIDASYMNEFGATTVSRSQVDGISTNRLSAAFLLGLGTEFHVWGPIAIDASLAYEGAMCDIFKATNHDMPSFTSTNAPVTYTVAEGQRIASFASYFSMSKMSCLSYSLGIIFRF